MLDVKSKLDRAKAGGESTCGGCYTAKDTTMSQDPILVTGAAGFIGFYVARRLLEDGRAVVGLDNLNAYYDPALKEARRAELGNSRTSPFISSTSPTASGWRRYFATATSLRSCTSPRRPACAIRCTIRLPMWMPT